MDVVNIKHPFLTVDAVILCDNDSIILIKRKNSPYKGFWALPGGFVEYGETVESAVLREVTEETGLSVDLNEISGVYSDPNRDPRGHVITICFTAAKMGLLSVFVLHPTLMLSPLILCQHTFVFHQVKEFHLP